MVATDFTEFIQDARLRLPGELVVAFGEGIHLCFPALELHVHPMHVTLSFMGFG